MITFDLCGDLYYKTNENYKYDIFYNDQKNNLIVFTPFHKDIDTYQIWTNTMSDADEYLTNTLKNENGIIVHWYKEQGTVSDFEIYYGLNVHDYVYLHHKKIMKILKEARNNQLVTMKYTYIKDGLVIPIVGF